MRVPIALFIGFVFIQSIAGFARTGSPMVALIGTLAYLAPMPAILLGYEFSRRTTDATRLLSLYLIFASFMVSGIYLSQMGYDSRLLKQVGEGLVIYDPILGKILLYCGFFRTPETAAWHGATAVCLVLLLSFAVRRKTAFKWAAGALILFVLGAVLFTGRRKFLVEVILFISVYIIFLIWFSKTIRSAVISKIGLVAGGLVVVVSIGYLYVDTDQYANEVRPYYQRGLNVEQEAGGRVTGLTIDAFRYVVDRNGFFGSGAGTGSQGSQYFRQEEDIVGGAAEGGLGKVLAELGVPGLALILWLSIGVARYLWSIINFIKATTDLDPTLAKLTFGLIAFLITNSVVFLIAHQVYGDPFVLILLGFFLGFVIATPRMHLASKVPTAPVPLRPPGAIPSEIIRTLPHAPRPFVGTQAVPDR
jgi:hypothetical protein